MGHFPSIGRGRGGADRGQVRWGSEESGQVRDAPAEVRDAEEWKWEAGPEPQAGDRHRAVRGPEEGSEGSAEIQVDETRRTDLEPDGERMHAVTTSSGRRSEEHTSELQSLRHLVCRLLLEKKKKR